MISRRRISLPTRVPRAEGGPSMNRAALSGLLLVVLAGCSSSPTTSPSTAPADTGGPVAPTAGPTLTPITPPPPSPSPSVAPTVAPTATPVAVDLYYPNEV